MFGPWEIQPRGIAPAGNDPAGADNDERCRRGDSFCHQIQRDIVYAYQPIIDMQSGEAFGFEALMRGFADIGHADPAAVLATARALGRTADLEFILREKAIKGFTAFAADWPTKLFFNANSELLQNPEYDPARTISLLRRHGLPVSRFCLELSETERVDLSQLDRVLRYWPERPLVALDDFGIGYSGLRVLCESKPDLVKIDRFFIANVDSHNDKRLFLSHIVSLSHALGIPVVAEGVETAAEFRICRELGCDLAQGYLIGVPSLDSRMHRRRYTLATELDGQASRTPTLTL